jgi:hypothetical protein
VQLARSELIARLILSDISWHAGDLTETGRQGELGVEASRRLGSLRFDTSACVSHCYFHFHQFEESNWDGAIAYGQQLAIYTEAEPLPWANFFSDRANALTA